MIHFQDERVTLHHGDCLDVLRELPDNSVDAVVTDPPYGLANTDPAHVTETLLRWVNGERDYLPGGAGFMGKAWDAFVPPVAVWDDCLRVLKPGGHVLAFAGSRTVDLMTLGLRLAGFEIRDSIAWLYGSGFPKSLDVSKAIDKAAGAEREVVGRYQPPNGQTWNLANDVTRSEVGAIGHSDRAASLAITAPATPDAERWQGWGTALKPAFEPVVVARKPLVGTVAANVLAHGTGALNIDGCRVEGERISTTNGSVNEIYGDLSYNAGKPWESHSAGRWPANVVLDETQADALDEQSGTLTSGANPTRRGSDKFRDSYGDFKGQTECTPARGVDKGGASRFFYVAKAPKSERPRTVDGTAHPTVKPLSLIRWLVRLVTPPGGTVLEPFAGSGTTVEACIVEGFDCIAIEREAEYLSLIEARIARATPVEADREPNLFDLDGMGA